MHDKSVAEPSVMTIPSTCTTTSDCSTEMLSDSMTDSSSVYARIHQLADAVKREVTAMENIRSGVEGEKESSVEIKAAQYDKMSQGSVIEERKRKGMEESDLEMAAKVKRALAKMRHLDSRLADLSKVRLFSSAIIVWLHACMPPQCSYKKMYFCAEREGGKKAEVSS